MSICIGDFDVAIIAVSCRDRRNTGHLNTSAYNECRYRVAVARPGAEGVATETDVESGLKG